jgi:hypothetical protein
VSGDLVNGLFEAIAGCLLWVNVAAAYRAKQFRGVAILPTAFFALWGYWNLYFYPSLGQWWSFLGGVNVVTANTVWVCQMVYYRERKVQPVSDVCLCEAFPCECPR